MEYRVDGDMAPHFPNSITIARHQSGLVKPSPGVYEELMWQHVPLPSDIWTAMPDRYAGGRRPWQWEAYEVIYQNKFYIFIHFHNLAWQQVGVRCISIRNDIAHR